MNDIYNFSFNYFIMERELWTIWGRAFLEYSKVIGNKIADGAVFVANKTKDGAIYMAEKTKEGAIYISEKSKPVTDKIKEGASYVAEKTKPVTDKIKEGASYVAEKTKPATDKIIEGASYIGTQAKSTYLDVKTKITGQPQEQPKMPEGNAIPNDGQNNQQNQQNFFNGNDLHSENNYKPIEVQPGNEYYNNRNDKINEDES